MLRRDVLKSLLALSALPVLGRGTLPAIAQAQARSTRRFVDAHCHFFNAADIPIRGFLERVVFEDYPETQIVGPSSFGPSLGLSVWRGLIATLADFLLK